MFNDVRYLRLYCIAWLKADYAHFPSDLQFMVFVNGNNVVSLCWKKLEKVNFLKLVNWDCLTTVEKIS